jgi:hypothetical protein
MSRAALLVLALAGLAHAAEPTADPAGPVVELTAGAGWFEDAFAIDDAGGRLAVVKTDPGGESQLQVIDVGQGGAVLPTSG